MDVVQALSTITTLQADKDDLERQNRQLTARLTQLEVQVAKLLHALRRNKSEKIDPAELLDGCKDLFTQEELGLIQDKGAAEETLIPEESPETRPRKRKKPRRCPEDLERRTTEVLLESDQRQCPACEAEMPRIGFDRVEKWGFQPATFYIQEFLLEKRACTCGQGIASARLPAQPVPKGQAMPDLLAYTMVAKFVDGLPYHRQAKIYQRAGLDVGDTTLGEWARQVADLLELIVYLMARQVVASGNLQADETGIRVQQRGGCHNAYFWAYGEPHGQVVYDFQMGRARDGPVEFLENFQGNLQTDGYAGYDAIGRGEGIVHFACWAHARRYFKEAQPTATARADKILKLIQGLYRIEAEARKSALSAAQRRELRQQRSRPLLRALEDNIDALRNAPKFLPKSPLGQAVQYCQRRWDMLTRYVDYG